MTERTRPQALTGGTIVTPSGSLSDGVLTLDGDSIDDVSTASRKPSMADIIDVSGKYVLPGLVDLHGDDIERYLFPRPEERVPTEMALRQSERAALGAGVTTKFHAVAFENAPSEQRSVDRATRLSRAIRNRNSSLDERVHARCELSETESVTAVTDLLSANDVGLVSLMNHVPGDGQYGSAEALSRRYEVRGDVSEAGMQDVINSRTTVGSPLIARRRDALIEAAGAAGIPVASHDDEDAAAVDAAADHGVDICEFPLTMAAARRAADRDLTVVMGAPNLARGGSLWGNLDARAAIDAGVVDVVCSDFRPQTMLTSVFADTNEPLHTRANRVTAAPAAAAGLDDRGRLVPGARADIIVVDPEPSPTVSRVFVAGEEVYRFHRST
jgi:alpha-D-ribose 1-methylphosphonate 5-triphosphate diphosphatase